MIRLPSLRLLLQHVVEVHAGVVLVETRRHLVLGVFHRQALRVHDALARLVVFPERAAAGHDRIEVTSRSSSGGTYRSSVATRGRQLRRVVVAGRRLGVALVNHRPAVELEHGLVALVVALRVHPDDAHVLARRLALADDLCLGAQRVAGVDGPQEAHVRVAEVGRRVQRDVRHRAPEHHVEHQQVVHDLALEAERLRELRASSGAAAGRPSARCRAPCRRPRRCGGRRA